MAKRKINITDQLEIFNLLRKFQSSKTFLWVFPDLEELTEKSPIHLAKMAKIEYDRIEVRPATENLFTFGTVNTLMFFSRDDEIAFKTKITKFNPEVISLPFPKEIFSITEAELDKVSLFKKISTNFLEKRNEKRKRPEQPKTVSLTKSSEKLIKKVNPKKFELIDLSPSGMGILANLADDFQIGDEIEVRYFGEKKLKGLIIGEVKSIRELKTGGFKVGILFLSRE